MLKLAITYCTRLKCVELYFCVSKKKHLNQLSFLKNKKTRIQKQAQHSPLVKPNYYFSQHESRSPITLIVNSFSCSNLHCQKINNNNNNNKSKRETK